MTEPTPDTTNQITEIVVIANETLNDDKTATPNANEYCQKLDIGGQKVVVVKHEDEIVSGGVHNYCVQGSPEHVGKPYHSK